MRMKNNRVEVDGSVYIPFGKAFSGSGLAPNLMTWLESDEKSEERKEAGKRGRGGKRV